VGVKERPARPGLPIRAVAFCADDRTEVLAVDGARARIAPHQVAKVRGALDERLGVPVPLEDGALGPVVIEVMSYSSVPVSLVRPVSMHFSGQAPELFEPAC
jgi:hypothetical protein